MARTESRTLCSIWVDTDFIALSARAQRMYWLLFSQPTISLCGVVALRARYWASLASGETAQSVQDALDELASGDKPFVHIDNATQEVWVRSFIRNDRVARSPKTAAAAIQQLDSIASPRLRALAEAELRAALTAVAVGTHAEAVAPARRSPSGPARTTGTVVPSTAAVAADALPSEGSSRREAPSTAEPSPARHPAIAGPSAVAEERSVDAAAKPQVNTLSDTLSDTPRVGARAAISPSPSPSPSISISPSPSAGFASARAAARSLVHGTTGDVAPQRGRDAGAVPDALTELAQRLALACAGTNRALVRSEAVDVVAWASRVLDVRAIDEVVGAAARWSDRPKLPRAVARALESRAHQAGLVLDPFRPSGRLATC